MKILIAGYGNIGKHIYKEFEKIEEIYIYDRYKNPQEKLLLESYHYAFICVPTEPNSNGSCDINEVKWIVQHIKADTIIIKSAVPVGTCEALNKDNIVLSPEYYGTTQHSLESPHFVILGGKKDYTIKVQQLYSTIKNGYFKYIHTNWRTAELAKYMENCFIAVKVTFCNEFAKIAEHYGIYFEDLRECFIADERVSPSHTYVYKDKPYYDSHCLNKDIPALIKMCEKDNISVPLMCVIYDINKKMKSKNLIENNLNFKK